MSNTNPITNGKGLFEAFAATEKRLADVCDGHLLLEVIDLGNAQFDGGPLQGKAKQKLEWLAAEIVRRWCEATQERLLADLDDDDDADADNPVVGGWPMYEPDDPDHPARLTTPTLVERITDHFEMQAAGELTERGEAYFADLLREIVFRREDDLLPWSLAQMALSIAEN